MNTLAKEKFDADINKLVIVNEISTSTTAITNGDEVSSFFVLLVSLKADNFDEKNIALISKLIEQKMIFILEYGDRVKLAIYHTKLMQTDWKPIEKLTIQLKGLNLDIMWENIIVQMGDMQIEQENSLDEQLKKDGIRRKIEKQIKRLEKQAWVEKQQRRKFELAQEIKILIRKLEEG